MRNKYRLLTLVIVLIAVAGFALKYDTITGYFAGGFNPVDDSEIPKTVNEILKRPGDMTVVDEVIGIKQYYEIGEDSQCILDCSSYCVENGMEYYDAYCVKVTECLCKCLPA